jgi:hypothetical protein
MPASESIAKPEPSPDAPVGPVPGPVDMTGTGIDEFARGWYDSSFDLRRGLWVIETDLDPAITHGVVVRKRGHIGGG